MSTISGQPQIDSFIYKGLVPGEKAESGTYRESYKEKIFLERMTLGDALGEVGLTEEAGRLDTTTREEVIQKMRIITEYTIITPRIATPTVFPIQSSGTYTEIHGFPKEKRFSIKIGPDMYRATEQKWSSNEDIKEIGVENVMLPVGVGRCPVYMETVEYTDPQLENHLLGTLNILTKNVEVEITQIGAKERLVFGGWLVAMGGDHEVKHYERQLVLSFKGWMFPNNGYYIWWRPE